MKTNLKDLKNLILVIAVVGTGVLASGSSFAQSDEDETVYEETTTTSSSAEEAPEETSVEDTSFSEE